MQNIIARITLQNAEIHNNYNEQLAMHQMDDNNNAQRLH